MELFHTSPTEIAKIDKSGRFGEFLCFSSKVYTMTAGKFVTYKIEVSDDDIIEAERLFYHEDAAKLDGIVSQVMNLLDCDEETAEAMLEQKEDCGDAEMSFDIQALAAQAAKILGFRGASMQDEQGRMYLIDMLGHEIELARV